MGPTLQETGPGRPTFVVVDEVGQPHFLVPPRYGLLRLLWSVSFRVQEQTGSGRTKTDLLSTLSRSRSNEPRPKVVGFRGRNPPLRGQSGAQSPNGGRIEPPTLYSSFPPRGSSPSRLPWVPSPYGTLLRAKSET